MYKKINRQEWFLVKSKLIYGEDFFDYSQTNYTKAHDYVNIICKSHGIFKQKAYQHFERNGCKLCDNERKRALKLKSQKQFIKDIKRVHGDNYDYSLVEYIQSNQKIKITCKEHGIFEQSANNHLKGQRCPSCFGTPTKSLNQFITEANCIHNNKYDYSKFNYINANTKSTIICKSHGEFNQKPIKHLGGNRCPNCTNIISKPSIKWLNSLNNSNIIPEYKLEQIKNYRVDGYDQTTNTVYQFHGSFYHADPRIFDEYKFDKMRKKTYKEIHEISNKKDQQIRDWGYNLIIMWEYDWNVLNNIKDYNIYRKDKNGTTI